MPAVLPIRYLDTETTGFRAGVDEVIDIAIVDADGIVLLDTLIRPKGKIPPEITRITGITNAMVRDAPTLDDVSPEIERLLTGAEMVAHNASFDRRMLGRLGSLPARETCTMKLAKPFLDGSTKLHDAALAAGHV